MTALVMTHNIVGCAVLCSILFCTRVLEYSSRKWAEQSYGSLLSTKTLHALILSETYFVSPNRVLTLCPFCSQQLTTTAVQLWSPTRPAAVLLPCRL